MKYNQDSTFKLKGNSFNKFDNKAVLQYAVGAVLYMPGIRSSFGEEILAKKYKSSICLDLEDAIGDDSVDEALKTIKSNLIMIKEALNNDVISLDDLPLIFIRVRTPKHMLEVADALGAELLEVITGFNLPKFDSHNAARYVKNFKFIKSTVKTPLYIMPILESKLIMDLSTRHNELENLKNILSTVSNDVLNIRVGATDFCNLYSIRRKITQTIYDIKVVSDCFSDIINVFGDKYVCAGPVWEYFSTDSNQVAWIDGLNKELELDKINGFIGKTSIHPVQVDFINSSYAISEEDYQDSLSILGMNSRLSGVEKGCNNNKMNEVKTHINWARKVSVLASIYGVKKG